MVNDNVLDLNLGGLSSCGLSASFLAMGFSLVL
jgi:hypothetical protein